MSNVNPTEPPADADAGTLRSHFEGKLSEQGGQITALQTENLLLRSIPGIDTSKPAIQAFISGYKGENTQEALLAEAAKWDLKPEAAAPPTTEVTPPAPTTTPVSATEQAALAAAAAAAGASTPPGNEGDLDPVSKGLAAFNDRLTKGEEREQAAAGFVDSVFSAAAKGDERVILSNGRQGQDT